MDDWRQLLRDYGALVYATAWRILRRREDVEDIVQEVFVEAWQARGRQSVEQLGGWLRRTTLCRAFDRLRAASRHIAVSIDEQPVAAGSSPDEFAELTELEERLRSAVAELPERERMVFSLRYFEAMTNQEIADALSITPSAVSTALSRSRQKLAQQLNPLLKGDGR